MSTGEKTIAADAARQLECVEGRLLGRGRPPGAPPDDPLHPGHGSKSGGHGGDGPCAGPF